MPTANTIPRGNISLSFVISATLSPSSVAPNTSAEQTFTIPSLRLGDFVYVNKPTTQVGLGVGGCRVSATDTLAVNFQNNTAATITPTAAEVYSLSVLRPENLNSLNTALLTRV